MGEKAKFKKLTIHQGELLNDMVEGGKIIECLHPVAYEFEAYARIDFRIMSINKMVLDMQSASKRSPIDIMVDKAVGNVSAPAKYIELRDAIKEMLVDLLADFEFIDAKETETYEAFSKMLEVLTTSKIN